MAEPLGICPSDNHEFLAVQAFGLNPQTPITRNVGCIGSLRDNPLQAQLARFGIEGRASSDLVIAVLERWAYSAHHRGETGLPFQEWQAGQILAIEGQQIEEKVHQCVGIPGVGCRLNHAERGRPVRTHST